MKGYPGPYGGLYEEGGFWDRLWSPDPAQQPSSRDFMKLFGERALLPGATERFAAPATEIVVCYPAALLSPALRSLTLGNLVRHAVHAGDEKFRQLLTTKVTARPPRSYLEAQEVLVNEPRFREFLIRACLHAFGYESRMRGWGRLALATGEIDKVTLLRILYTYLCGCSEHDIGFVMGIYGDNELPTELNLLMRSVNDVDETRDTSKALLLLLAGRAPVWYLMVGHKITFDDKYWASLCDFVVSHVLGAQDISPDDARTLLQTVRLHELRSWPSLRARLELMTEEPTE